MKKKRDPEIRDVDECGEKIQALLREYNCKIEFEPELNRCILVDNDTSEFYDDI